MTAARNALPRHELGFSLVELMVAMTLGLLITAAVGSAYVQGVRSHAEDDRQVRMMENGRFALDSITRDLRMISFWGEMLDPSAITTALTAGEDCGIEVFDAATAILYNNPNASPAVSQFDVTADDCPELTGVVRAGTSQIAIKHSSGSALAAGAADDVVYLRTNGSAGTFIDDAESTPPTSGYADWRYEPAVYYIGEVGGLPRLCRLRLQGLTFAATGSDECLADGVEQFYVQFGIDDDADGSANQYTASPSAAQMAQAVTARVFVLVRAETADPAYRNDKVYTLGDLEIEAGGDGFHRRVLSSTVMLRNPANLASLR